jgi:glycosyltransferase involved in cell wall biosynthesis
MYAPYCPIIVNYDVIIVNDGSQDDSLKLIKTSLRVKVDYLINNQIQSL